MEDESRNNVVVRKAVEAVHTSGNLTLLERKVVNILLLNAYEDLLTQNITHELPVAYLYDLLGWTESNNTHLLKQTLSKLATTKIEFDILSDKSGKKKGSSWGVMSFISFGGISEGVCSYRYDMALAEKLYDPEIYATINVSVQKEFGGSYALNLYENCLRYKKVKSTGWWDLPRLRKLLGADAEFYSEFKYLKSRVIDPSVKEINQVSDLLVEPEYRKNGRSVTHARFIVRENPQQQLMKEETEDEYAHIRESDLFKRMRQHKMGEKLAIALILEKGEEHVKGVVDYVESLDKKKKVKGSTGGYIRAALEKNWEMAVDKEEQAKIKKEEERKAEEEAKSASRDHKAREKKWKEIANAAIDALPVEVLEVHFEQFKSETTLLPALIKTGLKSEAFRAWLRPQMLPS